MLDSRTVLSDEALRMARGRCKSVARTQFTREVYFVGASDGPIKIGMACDVQRRLRELQNGSPVTLAILAATAGAGLIESWYHQRFAAHRLHGEWFTRHPDILAEIDRLNQTGRKAASTAPGPGTRRGNFA